MKQDYGYICTGCENISPDNYLYCDNCNSTSWIRFKYYCVTCGTVAQTEPASGSCSGASGPHLWAKGPNVWDYIEEREELLQSLRLNDYWERAIR